jgi:hypothetical protein
LECLADFDLDIFQIGFLHFLEKEIFTLGTLYQLHVPFVQWWVHTIRDDEMREMIKNRIRFYMKHK